jgi:hypothetical protein
MNKVTTTPDEIKEETDKKEINTQTTNEVSPESVEEIKDTVEPIKPKPRTRVYKPVVAEIKPNDIPSEISVEVIEELLIDSELLIIKKDKKMKSSDKEIAKKLKEKKKAKVKKDKQKEKDKAKKQKAKKREKAKKQKAKDKAKANKKAKAKRKSKSKKKK